MTIEKQPMANLKAKRTILLPLFTTDKSFGRFYNKNNVALTLYAMVEATQTGITIFDTSTKLNISNA